MKTTRWILGAALLGSLWALGGCGVGTYQIPNVEPVVKPKPDDDDLLNDIEGTDTSTPASATKPADAKPAEAKPAEAPKPVEAPKTVEPAKTPDPAKSAAPAAAPKTPAATAPKAAAKPAVPAVKK
jgi:microcystin-dependent protein